MLNLDIYNKNVIPEVVNEEAVQQKRIKVTLGHIFKKYAYTNDIQKMIYLVLKYANIEFDFDRDIKPPEIKLKIYQSLWKKFKQGFNYAILFLPNFLKGLAIFQICSIPNKIGNDWFSEFSIYSLILKFSPLNL